MINTKLACDKTTEKAAEAMQDLGAPVAMIIDRLMTYAVAQACAASGKSHTAAMLRVVADRVEAGAFDLHTGEGARH